MAQAEESKNSYDEELKRIDASIADLKIRDLAAAKERTQIAAKIQAAQFQRDILNHANQQRRKPGRTRRRPAEAPPPPPPPRSRPAAPPPRIATDGVTLLVDDPPPIERPAGRPRRTPPPPPAEHAPEASTQSVQNILLVLGALVIGVAAVVFAGVAVTNPYGRALVLAVFTALALSLAPGVSRRGLTSTAESIAVIGLVTLPMTLYALHGTAVAGGPGTPTSVFLGITFAVTAVVAFLYAGFSRLTSPRYAMVIALQPVPPLLAHPWVQSPAGWGLALTAVALLDLLLLTQVIRSGPLVPRWPLLRPPAGPAGAAHAAGAADFDAREAEPERPESRPEEPDLIIESLTPGSHFRLFPSAAPAGPPGSAAAAGQAANDWLRELTFALLCTAVAGALLYAGGALIGAHTVPGAVRSGLILILAAVTASAAARLLRNVLARNIAGGVLVLAAVSAVARVVAVASPHWTLSAAAAAVAVSGAVIMVVPAEVRRGPRYASTGVLALVGVFVAIDALRAAIAPVAAARPVWHADIAAYSATLADAVRPSGALMALSALLLTVAAAVALPAGFRHEGAVAGIALTALAVPASLAMNWSEAPWPLVLGAIGLGAAGLMARTRRVAVAHVAAAGLVGLFGAGSAVSAPWLTAAVLTALAGAGVMVAIGARQIPLERYGFAWLVGDWASGAAALALPGAAVTAMLALANGPDGLPPTPAVTVPALAFGFLAVAATLSYAAVFQVAQRQISVPLTLGTGLGATAMALAAILAPGHTAADIWVGALLLAAAGLLFSARSLDNGRRADRMLDGTDIGAAAATVAVCGALSRVAALAFPDAPLLVSAVVVLLVGFAVRALQADLRRGPVYGLITAGLVVGAIAGFIALHGGLRILAAPGPVWASDLTGYSAAPAPDAWQAPLALVVIAVAAAATLPKPMGYDIGAVCAAVATIGAPAAFGLPWWTPLLLGGAVAVAYGVGSAATGDPRAAYARAGVAGVVSLHAVAVGLVRPWSTAVGLTLVVLVGVLVAGLNRVGLAPVAAAHRQPDPRDWREEAVTDPGNLALDDTGMPRHRAQIGGVATMAVLLAVPGVFAATAADHGRSAQIVLTAALAASSIGLAVLTVLGRWIPQYLPFATIGLVGGATVTALASLPTDRPTALYAAAAALLGVIAELLRGATAAPGLTVAPTRSWIGGGGYRRPRWTEVRPSGLRDRWMVDPASGAVVVAAIPTVIALISMAPALKAALVDPLRQVSHVWQGPLPVLLHPDAGAADGTTVLAAVLLTVAAALAATGFGGKVAEAVPVILPGLAITLLIAPVALHAGFPMVTRAALIVFILVMLGLALTPPPIATRAPLVRGARTIVFVIGLLAGGAGLAGSLATRPMTLSTLGFGVGVGLVAALAGRTSHARILGWLFAAFKGQFFVLAAALTAGVERQWAAFGVLAVGAALLILESALPRLGLPHYRAEATTVEWSGYGSALIAGALAFDAPAQLAALLAAWGAVLGLAVGRPGRDGRQRRIIFWLAIGFEFVGWCVFMTLSDVAVPEAYTLPFAALALLAGVREVRLRSDVSSWAAYGPALLAAFVPTVAIVLTTNAGDLRELLLLLGAVGTLIVGSVWRQQAPVIVGAVATAVAAIHFAVTLVGPWLVLVPIGVVLLLLGATNESRRRTDRLRGAVARLR